jgi:ribonuclease HII
MIVGIDEVGRGCWAGPLCVVALAGDEASLQGVRDSKQLSRKMRAELYKMIVREAGGIGIGWASAAQIDAYGLGTMLKHTARRAYEQLDVPHESVIIDGTVNLLGDKSAVTMKKADSLVASVSAASIVAKVLRDEYMARIDGHFPEYGFAKHVGYGTAAHAKALAEFGPCSIHRHSFAPVGAVAAKKQQSTSSGQLAEGKAAEYLAGLGYEILQQNWKTKWCEVDIIAAKGGVIHFVEVKYRRDGRGGTGLEAITGKKLRQMKFAAEMWVKWQDYAGPHQLSAVELAGDDAAVSRFLPLV